jgi:ABC-type sugar transport system substrate-binding protein
MATMRKSIATLAAVIGLVGAAGATAAAAEARSSCYYSLRGCVHVRGYYEPSTGTYVRPHVRNYPG